jgi:hypothetical protein
MGIGVFKFGELSASAGMESEGNGGGMGNKERDGTGVVQGLKRVQFPLFEKVEELTLTSDFRRCGTCGGFKDEGLGCGRMFPNAKCWYPAGSIRVEDERKET